MIRFFMPTLVEEKQQIQKADLPEFSHSKKPSPIKGIVFCAMFALGLETNFEKIKNLGIKPLLLAFIMFIWLVGFGFIINKFII